VRALALIVSILGASLACVVRPSEPEGLPEEQLPAEVRADYHMFAQRCSKCHSLARALTSGITDDATWADYVERMRRQAGSGISPQDAIPILRFLHFYSIADAQRLPDASTDPSSDGPTNPSTDSSIESSFDPAPDGG
jgi:hypothetical protein